jgi:hypothetical protein
VDGNDYGLSKPYREQDKRTCCVEGKKGHNPAVKRYWEIIADNLKKTGWSWGCVCSDRSPGANNLEC